jgi:hypothetical protein
MAAQKSSRHRTQRGGPGRKFARSRPAKAAGRFARSDSAKKVGSEAEKVVLAGVGTLLAGAGTAVTNGWRSRRDRRRNREDAITYARQVQGKFSEDTDTLVEDRRRFVVWDKAGVPVKAFPPLEGDAARIKDVPELKDFPLELLKAP